MSITLSVAAPPQRLGARHQLVLCIDGIEQRSLLPARGDVIVGRTRACDVRIQSATVSRRHALISVVPGAVVLSNLHSQSGLRVNGERVTADRLLAYGDIITFGDITAVLEEADGTTPETVEQPSALAGDGNGETDLVEHQLANMTGVKTVEPAPASPPSPKILETLGEATRVFERGRIEAALASTGGNKTRAAKLLDVPLRTFMDKVKRHGIG